MSRIDFDVLLARGASAYDKAVGDWWVSRSEDAAHRRAYDNVAAHTDYACGNGQLLRRLARLLPEARIVGLDGSKKLLTLTAAALRDLGHDAAVCDASVAFNPRAPRIRLVQSLLPSFQLQKGRADAVVFCFPNITQGPGDQPRYDRNGYKHRGDLVVAKMLARFREMDPEDEVSTLTPKEQLDDLMTTRVISRDLRGLLKRGGKLMRVEYANGTREELSELSQWRYFFAEGALESPIKEEKAEAFFHYTGCKYYRSKVILDVYHQTRDKTDRKGGYYIADFLAR
jgi:SAM-dependent methyltransferase